MPMGFDPGTIPEQVRGVLDEVWEVYGQFSAWKLRNVTHTTLEVPTGFDICVCMTNLVADYESCDELVAGQTVAWGKAFNAVQGCPIP